MIVSYVIWSTRWRNNVLMMKPVDLWVQHCELVETEIHGCSEVRCVRPQYVGIYTCFSLNYFFLHSSVVRQSSFIFLAPGNFNSSSPVALFLKSS